MFFFFNKVKGFNEYNIRKLTIKNNEDQTYRKQWGIPMLLSGIIMLHKLNYGICIHVYNPGF